MTRLSDLDVLALQSAVRQSSAATALHQSADFATPNRCPTMAAAESATANRISRPDPPRGVNTMKANGSFYAQGAPVGKPRRYVQNESYMHDAAKHVVAQWLRDAQDKQGVIQMGDVYAKTSRVGGMCGVYIEYPIGINGEGVSPCWDELYSKHSDFLTAVYGEPVIAWPSFNSLAQESIQTRCICDIVMIHKGAVSVAIEVVHSHPTPQWKRDFLREQGIQLFEVRAQAVLRLTRRPATLPPYRAPKGDAA